ncbi:MAG: RCC1 repeat-containing protein [Nitrospirota bacterium]|nr:RCC1 repeat-containing protein [Nitrospirota bacterium]
MKQLLIIIVVIALIAIAGVTFLPRLFTSVPDAASGPAVLSGVGAAAAGFGHTLAVKVDRTVWAWGRNDLGQLGDGTTADRTTARQVAGISGITAIAAGEGHSLALTAEGTVVAWGGNEHGQLGDEETLQRSLPREIDGLLSVTAIAAGENHSLALKSDGTVIAWGSNESGQLGDGTKESRGVLRPVPGVASVSAIASGRGHVAAALQDGTVLTWGANNAGQLGDGSTRERNSPAPVSGLAGITAVACGHDHTLALRSDGTVWAWGANDAGQIGDGTTEMRQRPVQVPGLEGAVALAAGHRHSLALLGNGDVRIWGSNFHYQQARRFGAMQPQPQTVASLDSGVAAIASGAYHVLAVDGAGTLRSWGFNHYGQLGDATLDYRSAPVQTLASAGGPAPVQKPGAGQASAKDSAIIDLAAGRSHSAALKGDGTVWTWGDNFHGQLGDGARRTIRPRPQLAQNLYQVKAIAAGNNITLALRQDGTVWAWGNNENRQLGDGSKAQSRALPVQVQGLTDVITLASSGNVSLALRSDGTVWTWGLAFNGAGANAAPQTPAKVAGVGPAAAIAAGHDHFLVLCRDGTVWAWGKNEFGQVGDGSTVERRGPVSVAGLTDVAAIAAGGKHSVALKKDGTVWAWGLVRAMRTKNYLEACSPSPAAIAGLQDITAIAAGDGHTIALKKDGTIWGWGRGSQSQLGGRVATMTDTVVQVTDLTGVARIAAGWDHNLAMLMNGTLVTWGYNEYGQTGDGSQGLTEHGSKTFNKSVLGKRTPGPVAWSVPAAPQGDRPKRSVKTVSLGGTHSGILMDDGTVWVWGDNSYQQLGGRADITTPDGKLLSAVFHKEKPFPMVGLSSIIAIDMGMFHSLVLRNDRTVAQWGRSYDDSAYEQKIDSFGLSERIAHDRSMSSGRGKPAAAMSGVVGELTDVAAVSAGAGFSLALRQDGTVWAWGVNSYGQLGDGTTAHRKVPKPVQELSGITAIAAGGNYAVALANDGSVWGWGLTSYRKSGGKMFPQASVKPLRIAGLAGVIAVAAAGEPLALMADGTVWSCWTWQREDPLAFGPAPIAGLENITEISSEGNHTVALGRSGVYEMNGYRTIAKDGNMTTTRHIAAVEEADGAEHVAAGASHGMLLKRDGTVWAWGDNEFGQLGDKTEHDSMYPLLIRIP